MSASHTAQDMQQTLLKQAKWQWPEILFWLALASLYVLFPSKLSLLSEIGRAHV